MAVHASPFISLAGLADLGVPRPGHQRDALTSPERLGITKLDLGSPDGAGDVDPVVVGCSLQGLPRVRWSVHLLLLLPVVLGCFLGVLPFLTLALALLFRLLLVRDL